MNSYSIGLRSSLTSGWTACLPCQAGKNNAADLIHNHPFIAGGHQTRFKITILAIDQYQHNGSAKIQMNVLQPHQNKIPNSPPFIVRSQLHYNYTHK